MGMETRLVVKMEAGVDLKFYVVSYFLFNSISKLIREALSDCTINNAS